MRVESRQRPLCRSPPPPPPHGLHFPTTQLSLVRSRGEHQEVTLHNLHTCLLPLNLEIIAAEKYPFRHIFIWEVLKEMEDGVGGLL